MTNEKPSSFAEVLAGEYRALRPGSALETGSEQDLVSRMHEDEEPLSALCISGGGIRSATFALGAIQGLAERGLLTRFDYLSTVSGGGYIGGWLTRLGETRGGAREVVPRLRRDAPPPAAGRARPHPAPARVQQLPVARGRGLLGRPLDPDRDGAAQHPPQLDGARPAADAVLMVPRLLPVARSRSPTSSTAGSSSPPTPPTTAPGSSTPSSESAWSSSTCCPS